MDIYNKLGRSFARTMSCSMPGYIHRCEKKKDTTESLVRITTGPQHKYFYINTPDIKGNFQIEKAHLHKGMILNVFTGMRCGEWEVNEDFSIYHIDLMVNDSKLYFKANINTGKSSDRDIMLNSYWDSKRQSEKIGEMYPYELSDEHKGKADKILLMLRRGDIVKDYGKTLEEKYNLMYGGFKYQDGLTDYNPDMDGE